MLTRLFKDGKFVDRAVRTLSETQRSEILHYGPTDNIVEAIYWIKNNLSNYPKNCLHCGNVVTKFISFNQAYLADYCSTKCSALSKIVQETKREINQEKYGVDFPCQTKDVKDKIAKKQQIRNIEKSVSILEEITAQGFKVIAWDATKINNPATLQCSRKHQFSRQVEGWYRWAITCPKCSKGRSHGEIQVEDFIQSSGVKVQQSGKRKILGNGSELDIYVPTKKFAVEYNGLYFHSSLTLDEKSKMQHVVKQDLAESHGITLFQILESEWMNNTNIVKSKIKHTLGFSERIFGRKCTIDKIDILTANEFLKRNHLQGACETGVNFGLFYMGGLVALMSFNKNNTGWELLRYSTEIGYTVVGGPSKLLNYFKGKYDPQYIISRVNRRWSSGNLYLKLGFTIENKTPPNYQYFNNAGLANSKSFQKHKLKTLLVNFDKKKSEKENMIAHGYRILWDCGDLIFRWNKNTYAKI